MGERSNISRSRCLWWTLLAWLRSILFILMILLRLLCNGNRAATRDAAWLLMARAPLNCSCLLAMRICLLRLWKCWVRVGVQRLLVAPLTKLEGRRLSALVSALPVLTQMNWLALGLRCPKNSRVLVLLSVSQRTLADRLVLTLRRWMCRVQMVSTSMLSFAISRHARVTSRVRRGLLLFLVKRFMLCVATVVSYMVMLARNSDAMNGLNCMVVYLSVRISRNSGLSLMTFRVLHVATAYMRVMAMLMRLRNLRACWLGCYEWGAWQASGRSLVMTILVVVVSTVCVLLGANLGGARNRVVVSLVRDGISIVVSVVILVSWTMLGGLVSRCRFTF